MGANATIFLVPASLYILYSSIRLTQGSTLATLGYPSFTEIDNQQAILETRGANESTAVNMLNLSHASLRNIHVRGCRGWGRTMPSAEEQERMKREEGKLGWLEGGGALVLLGGPEAKDASIVGCRLEDPRGWTACHIADYARRIKVVGNIVGPCGQQAPTGPWADGLSCAGFDTTVSSNTIVDATDGAIVIFCAPGSIISGNKVIARSRNALGAINMVDEFPFKCNYSGTRVICNEISTEGDAYINLAIGIGSSCWGEFTSAQKPNYGGEVDSNLIGPGTFGYGIALSTARSFTVLSNRLAGKTAFRGDNAVVEKGAPPSPFLVDRARTSDCTLQSEFVDANVEYLIGIRDGLSRRIRFDGGQLVLKSGGQGIELDGVVFRLDSNSQLVVLERLDGVTTGAQLWSSRSQVSNSASVLSFDRDGRLAIISSTGNQVLWNPSIDLPLKSNLPAARPSIQLSSQVPYCTMWDSSRNLVWASSYEFYRDRFILGGGDWIRIASTSLRDGDSAALSGPPSTPRFARPVKGDGLKGIRHFIHDLSISDSSSTLSSSMSSGSSPPLIASSASSESSESPESPASSSSANTAPTSTYLFLSPITARLILHSSPSPDAPIDTAIHWSTDLSAATAKVISSRVVFQGDGNVVLYVEREGRGVKAEWATGTNPADERRGDVIILRGSNDAGGARFMVVDAAGVTRFSS